MESHTGGMPLCGLGAPETERVGATRSHDVEVGHTMGPPSERSHAASRNAITPRRSGLTTANRLRYPSSTEATPELFHGTRDTTLHPGAVRGWVRTDPSASRCARVFHWWPSRVSAIPPPGCISRRRLTPASTKGPIALVRPWRGHPGLTYPHRTPVLTVTAGWSESARPFSSILPCCRCLGGRSVGVFVDARPHASLLMRRDRVTTWRGIGLPRCRKASQNEHAEGERELRWHRSPPLELSWYLSDPLDEHHPRPDRTGHCAVFP